MRALLLVIATFSVDRIRAQDAPTATMPQPLVASAVIALPEVRGRIDHLAIDRARERLFVAALGNDSVEILDLKRGRHLRRVAGLSEPQGILYLDDVDRVVVACGGSGTCEILAGDDGHPIATVRVEDDADNLRYDPLAKLVWVACGDGALTAIDARTWQIAGSIALPSHPEGFQLDADGRHACVNLPGSRAVALCDLHKRKLIDRWRIDDARAPFPLALLDDGDAGTLLAIGCREPARILLRARSDGSAVGAVELAGDVDDLCIDARRHRIYATCGAGSVEVYRRDGVRLELLASVPTAAGARTGLFVPERDQLFVAVPRRGKHDAEIRVFTTQDDPDPPAPRSPPSGKGR